LSKTSKRYKSANRLVRLSINSSGDKTPLVSVCDGVC